MTPEVQKIIEQNKDHIRLLTGDKYIGCGLYSVSIDGKLVYIGKSTDMVTRIANHMYHIDYQDQPKTNKYVQLYRAKEDGHKVSFDLLLKCSESEVSVEEAKMIRQYLPALNTQIPKIENPKSYDTNKKAKTIKYEEILKDG